jgi:hypothetical protein
MGCSSMGPSMNELSDIETTPAGLPSDTQFDIPRGLSYQSMGNARMGCLSLQPRRSQMAP